MAFKRPAVRTRLSPPQANKIEPGFVCFFFYHPKAIRNHGLPFLLTNKYPLPFPLSIPPKFDCLSAGKREHMSEKGKHLYNLFGKRQRAKEKSLLYRLLIRTFTQEFYDRLLSRGVCDNMPTKGKLRRITSTIPYNKNDEAVLRKNTRERKKRRISQAVQRETPLRSRFPLSLSVCVTACACLAERSDATCHSKHTPRLQSTNLRC